MTALEAATPTPHTSTQAQLGQVAFDHESKQDLKQEKIAAPAGVKVDTSQIPELGRLEGLEIGQTLLERLDPIQRKRVEAIAAKERFDDPMEVTKFGVGQLNDARKVIKLAGKLVIDDATLKDLGPKSQIVELMDELRSKMVELNIGDLKDKWYDKWLKHMPDWIAKHFDRAAEFLRRREKVTSRVEEVLSALSSEKLDLEELYNRSHRIREQMKQARENITEACGVLILAIDKKVEEYKDMAEEFSKKDKLDDDEIDQIDEMKEKILAMHGKLVTYLQMRVETRNSMAQMRLLRNTMLKGVGMLDNEMQLQESVWRNQINNALMEYRLRSIGEVIQIGRDSMEKLVQLNTENIGQTVKAISELAAKPGISIDLLVKSIETQRALREEYNKYQVETVKMLKAAQAKLEEIDKNMSEGSNDLSTLREVLTAEEEDEGTAIIK